MSIVDSFALQLEMDLQQLGIGLQKDELSDSQNRAERDHLVYPLAEQRKTTTEAQKALDAAEYMAECSVLFMRAVDKLHQAQEEGWERDDRYGAEQVVGELWQELEACIYRFRKYNEALQVQK